MKTRPALLALAGLLAVGALAGCSQKALEHGRDAPVSSHNTDPARVIEMPDGFSNVASKCDGPNMVYVIFHSDSSYGSVSVVPNDPRCEQ